MQNYVRQSAIRVDQRNLSDVLQNVSKHDLEALIKYVRMVGATRSGQMIDVPTIQMDKKEFLEVASFVRENGKMADLLRMVVTRQTSSQAPNSANGNALLNYFGGYEVTHNLLSTTITKRGEGVVDKKKPAEVILEEEVEAKLLGDEHTQLNFVDGRYTPDLPVRGDQSVGFYKGLGDIKSCRTLMTEFVDFPMEQALTIQEISYHAQAKSSSNVTTIVPSVVTQMAEGVKKYFPEGMTDTVTQNLKRFAISTGFEPHGTMTGPEFAAAMINHFAKHPDRQLIRDTLADMQTIMVKGDTPTLRQFWTEKRINDKVIWKAAVKSEMLGGAQELKRVESIPPYVLYPSLKEIPTLETTTVTLQGLLDKRGGGDNAPAAWVPTAIDGLAIGGKLRAAHNFLMMMRCISIRSNKIYVLTITDTYLIALLKCNYPHITFVIQGKNQSNLNEIRSALEFGGIIYVRQAHGGMFSGVDPDKFVLLDLFDPMPKIAGKVFETAVKSMTVAFQSYFRNTRQLFPNFVTCQYIGYLPRSVNFAPCPESHMGHFLYSPKISNFESLLMRYDICLSYAIYQAWFVTLYPYTKYVWNGSVGILAQAWKAPVPKDGANIKSGIAYELIPFAYYNVRHVILSLPDVTAAMAEGGTLEDFDMSLVDLLPVDCFARLVENDAASRVMGDAYADHDPQPKGDVKGAEAVSGDKGDGGTESQEVYELPDLGQDVDPYAQTP